MPEAIFEIPMFEPLYRWSIMTTTEFFEICSLIRHKTLDAIHPRDDALLEATDNMLLLHDELRQMWITIQRLETWIADVLMPHNPPKNIRLEFHKYNTIENFGLYAAYAYRGLGIHDMANPNYEHKDVTMLEIEEAMTLARSLWEECMLLATDFEDSCFAFQKAMRRHEQSFIEVYHHWQVMSGFISVAHNNTMCAFMLVYNLNIVKKEDWKKCRKLIGDKDRDSELDAALERLDKEYLKDLFEATELSPWYMRAIWSCNEAMKRGVGDWWTRKSRWRAKTGSNWSIKAEENNTMTIARMKYDEVGRERKVKEKDEWIDENIVGQPKPKLCRRKPKTRRTKRKKKIKRRVPATVVEERPIPRRRNSI